MQRDDVEPPAAFVADLAGRAGEADRRLDRAEHRDPVEPDGCLVLQRRHRSAASNGSRTSAPTAPGSATVS